MTTAEPQVTYLRDYSAPSHTVDRLSMTVGIFPGYCEIFSKFSIVSATGKAADLCLDGVDLELIEIFLDEKLLEASAYRTNETSLFIANAPAKCEIAITARIHPETNSSLEGFYQSGSLLCTQCEAHGFRKITYFLDRPDVMTTYRVRIEADRGKYPTLLGNGNKIDQGDLPEGRHFVVWDDPFPKPSYLFAMVAGDLACLSDTHQTKDHRTIQLGIYADQSEISQCHHAMASLKKSMAWDEERFGLICDLDQYNVVAVRDFNMGAMENKGLNVFNSALLLADDVSTTDSRYRDIEDVIAHEYFHNWTGNRVTCRDWFQLCLKEGLTVFREHLFTADQNSAHIVRIEQITSILAAQFAEDAGPMAHPPRPDRFIEINNFYTVTVYLKGAEIVRMLQTILGEQGFDKGLALYLSRHDGQAATQEDFVQALADANSCDLSSFMPWYTQAGTPHVSMESFYDSDQQTYTMTFTQKTASTKQYPNKTHLHIPIRIALLDPEGNMNPLIGSSEKDGESEELGLETVVHLKEACTSFTFKNIASKPIPSLLRNFSAPVKMSVDLSTAERIHLIKYDNDPINRWRQAQVVWKSEMLRLIDCAKEHQELKPCSEVLDLFDYLVSHPDQSDLEFTAGLWKLPSYQALQVEQEVIDVDATIAAGKALRHGMAETSRQNLLALAEHLTSQYDDSFSRSAIGVRALRNRVFDFLGAIEDIDALEMIVKQFKTSKHMSDVLGSFHLICNSQTNFRPKAIDDFYQRYQAYSTTIDDWFAVQASSILPGSLERVVALSTHKDFKLATPNRARSLIMSFCYRNPAGFHALDGSGYQFCAEYVTKLDAINPQIATTLARAFLDWRRYPSKRSTLMEQQLRALYGRKDLSGDVFEILDRSLS